MKRFRKLLSLVLTVIMVLAMAAPTYAGTITIGNAVNGQTYNAYKIFDVVVEGEGDNATYAYRIDSTSDWFSVIQSYLEDEGNGEFELRQVGGTTVYNVIWTESSFTQADAADLAVYLNANKTGKDVDATATAASGTASIQTTEAGYYFVDSSMGALCALNTVNDTQTINEKNAAPEVEKKILEDGNEQSEISKKVGDKVDFQITITAGGKADTTYVLHDSMSDGLTFDVNTPIQVEVNQTAVNTGYYTISREGHTCTSDPQIENCTFEITFDQTYTSSLEKDTEIVVTYSAIINEDAIEDVNLDGSMSETNKVTLQYGNSFTVDSDDTQVVVNLYQFDIVKTDTNKALLNGAEFALYEGENHIDLVKVSNGNVNVYRPATEDDKIEGFVSAPIEAGIAKIIGLENTTYRLVETKAPQGYNILNDSVEVSLSAGSNTTEFTGEGFYAETDGGVWVENSVGVLLPGTGGIGTTVFYAAGIILMAGAVFFVVRRKRA